MTLTNEYQFIGRSNYVPSHAQWFNYYVLLYAKTVADTASGRHTVYVKQRLVCEQAASFYDYQTSAEIKVDGTSIVAWEWAYYPTTQWNATPLTEDGITYPAWIDLREGSITIPVGHGIQTDILIESRWELCGDHTASHLPISYWRATVNATVTLPMIAGASQPSVSAERVAMGEELIIHTNGVAGAGLRYELTYQFGAHSGTISENAPPSCKWYPDVSLAQQIPNAVSGVAVITCTTYSGDTVIGSKQVTVTLTVPESVVPEASATWEDSSGAFDLVGCLVQNISKLAVTVNGTGSYGSTITAAAVKLNGKACGGGTVAESGELPLEITVTDSRGRTGSAAYTVTIEAYSVPSLSLNASRCMEDGEADDTGDYAKITVTGFVTELGGVNSALLTLHWGGQNEEVPMAVGEISYTKVVYADPNATMSISAVLNDRLVAASRSMILSTGYATLDLLAGGKGIAFGKAATREGFDCAMPAYFHGGLYGISADGTVDRQSLFDRVAALEAKL